MRALSFLLLTPMILLPASASALEFKPWLGVNGSWGTYSMSDVNDMAGDFNAGLREDYHKMAEIHDGFGIGVTTGLDLTRRLSAGLSFDQLSATTDVGYPANPLVFKFTANAFRVFGDYALSRRGRLGMHIGLGAGLVSEFGLLVGGGAPTSDLTGKGPLGDLAVGADWWATPEFAVTGSAGYRYAKVGEVKVDGRTFRNFDNSKIAADYSGVLVRLGVKLALTK